MVEYCYSSLQINSHQPFADAATYFRAVLYLSIKPPVLHTKLIDDKFCVLMRKGHLIEHNLTRQTNFAAKKIGVSNHPSVAEAEDILFQQQGLVWKISVHCQNYYAAKVILIESNLLLTEPYLLVKD